MEQAEGGGDQNDQSSGVAMDAKFQKDVEKIIEDKLNEMLRNFRDPLEPLMQKLEMSNSLDAKFQKDVEKVIEDKLNEMTRNFRDPLEPLMQKLEKFEDKLEAKKDVEKMIEDKLNEMTRNFQDPLEPLMQKLQIFEDKLEPKKDVEKIIEDKLNEMTRNFRDPLEPLMQKLQIFEDKLESRIGGIIDLQTQTVIQGQATLKEGQQMMKETLTKALEENLGRLEKKYESILNPLGGLQGEAGGSKGSGSLKNAMNAVRSSFSFLGSRNLNGTDEGNEDKVVGSDGEDEAEDTFKLREIWKAEDPNAYAKQHFKSTLDECQCTWQTHRGFPLHPASNYRIAWDCVSLFCILYDIISTPIYLSFQPDMSFGQKFMSWFTLVFWTCDLPLTFVTGYYDNGFAELGYERIRKRYLRSWFPFDISIVTLDWVTTASASGMSGVSGIARSLRILRIVRSIRLLRLLKLGKTLETMQSRVGPSSVVLVRLVVCTLGMLMVCHITACVWHGIGQSPKPGQISWIQANNLQDASIEYLYLCSLHWTLTQFTPANMEINPHNTDERAFAVLFMLLAYLGFSAFISYITSSFVAVGFKSAGLDKQFGKVQELLNGMDSAGAMDLAQAWQHTANQKEKLINEKDRELLQMLPEHQQIDLLFQEQQPLLAAHTMFARIAEVDADVMKRACFHALDLLTLPPETMLFRTGMLCRRMYFVKSGRLTYQMGEDDSEEDVQSTGEKKPDDLVPNKRQSGLLQNRKSNVSVAEQLEDLGKECFETEENKKKITLTERQWACEATLWTQSWVHVGSVHAAVTSEVLTLDPVKFSVIVAAEDDLGEDVCQSLQKYANDFIEDLNLQKKAGTLTDLQGAAVSLIDKFITVQSPSVDKKTPVWRSKLESKLEGFKSILPTGSKVVPFK